MAPSDQNTARFRSATEFPKTTEQLARTEADALYEEMRDCLIFTNRSRAQLIRRNEEHKQKALALRSNVERLQTTIQQLSQEKQQLATKDRLIVTELEAEIRSMSLHLEQLSVAFDAIPDIEDVQQSHWGMLAFPHRLLSFLRAVKAVVTWWRQDHAGAEASATPQLPGSSDLSEEDRRNNPQMYTDAASINRSLREDS